MEKLLKKNQKFFFVVADIFFIAVSYFLAAVFLDKLNVRDEAYFFVVTIAFTCTFHCISFDCFKLYNIFWAYAGLNDYFKVIRVMILDIFLIITIFFFMPNTYDEKLIFLAGIFSIMLLLTLRVAIRALVIYITYYYNKLSAQKKKNLLIVGAGSAAKLVIDEMSNINSANSRKYNIVGLIDDDVAKIGCYFSGFQVLGNRNSIPKIVDINEIQEIVVAIPSLKEKDKQEILQICNNTGCTVKLLPPVCRFIDAKSEIISRVREIQVEDLLMRDEIILDNDAITSNITGKVILVTGGGGSIGSELCRQIAQSKPSKLLIVDIYENNAYDIQMELLNVFPTLDIETIIASVRDNKRMESIFEKYRPYAVFHAAAHKHVPLMEDSPCEAVKNNILGTYNVAKCADKFAVEKFVLVSTDKAVNPTNIMGASKRMCEMIIQAMQPVSKTKYVAVRFGNVLGSNGSVIPLFKKQIQAGGPITLTHKEITRFFMTIPEAVSLILQSFCYAEGGEIFVLDMGKPVKIYDLAENLIRLSGFKPHEDIKIEIIGLRPGEKLYEELLMEEEGLRKTAHKKIFIANPIFNDLEAIEKEINTLKNLADNNNSEDVRTAIINAVPTYVPAKNEAIQA